MTSTKHLTGHIFSSLVVLLMLSFSGVAQDTSERPIIIEIEGLDAYTYGDIARGLKESAVFSIQEACVPIGVIAFDSQNSNGITREEFFDRIKSEVQSLSGLTSVTLTELDTEGMRNLCKEARRGRVDEQ